MLIIYYHFIFCYSGDINQDGTVSADDALAILKHSAKLEIINNELKRDLADLNYDNTITSEDALETLQTAAKLKDMRKYQEQPTITPVTPSEENKNRYNWIVAPTIEVDDINYSPIGQYLGYWMNDFNQQGMGDIAIAKKNNTYALINIDGSFVTGFDYKHIEMHSYEPDNKESNSFVLTRVSPKYEEMFNQPWDQYFYKSGKLVAADGIGGVGTYKGKVVYKDGVLNLIQYEMESHFPSHPVGVQKVDVFDNPKGKYAIAYQSKLLTDFIYDECGSFAEGLLAVKRNGKWGYVDIHGEEIISCEYDDSWQGHFEKYILELDESGDIIKSEFVIIGYAYAASEGTVVLRKGFAWKLTDLKGNIILPEGEFEAIRPVYQGKCWVKKDGKWGVIQLSDEILGSL